MCATGAYTRVNHSAMNSSAAENFMRSANAPAISAGVMMAKVIWKVTNTPSGISPTRLSGVMPARKARLKPPTKLLNVTCPSTMPELSTTML
ncbi:hypothetical protein D3C85_1486570 [compost metagenome]